MIYFTENPSTFTMASDSATSLLQQDRTFDPFDCETLPEAILGAVAHYYGTTSVELVQLGRDEPRATQRLTAAYLIKKIAKLSNTKLARLLQRGHASTVSHLMPSVERKVASGKISQEDIVRLNSIIGEIVKNWSHGRD